MPDREKVINCLTDIEQIMVCRQEICPREELQYWIELQEGVADALALLKDRTKDYEAWAKAIGADTCVNCCHASFNRNDGKSTCPIEHNFALVKDGFCHLFMRMEGR